MVLKGEIPQDEIEPMVRRELARRFPSLHIHEVYVPYYGRDITFKLSDEPVEPEPPEVEPVAEPKAAVAADEF